VTIANKYYKQGQRLFEEGKYKEAEDIFWQAVLIDPNHWKAWFDLGLMCYCRGAFEESKRAHLNYQRLIQQEKQNKAA